MIGRSRRVEFSTCGVLAIICLSLAMLSTTTDSLAYRFPLWKDVPGRPFVVLDHGVIHGTEWAAFASRSGVASRGRMKPCITVAEFTEEGSYSNAGSCGWLAPELGLRHPPISPLMGGSRASVFAMSFTGAVRRVEIELGSGRSLQRAPRRLTQQQAEKARLPRLGYVAMALGEDACISRIKGFNALGELVLDSETHEC